MRFLGMDPRSSSSAVSTNPRLFGLVFVSSGAQKTVERRRDLEKSEGRSTWRPRQKPPARPTQKNYSRTTSRRTELSASSSSWFPSPKTCSAQALTSRHSSLSSRRTTYIELGGASLVVALGATSAELGRGTVDLQVEVHQVLSSSSAATAMFFMASSSSSSTMWVYSIVVDRSLWPSAFWTILMLPVRRRSLVANV